MLVNISGNKCISCARFTQYYTMNYAKEFERTDCGYCRQHGKKVRAGDRCRKYCEASNVYLRKKE